MQNLVIPFLLLFLVAPVSSFFRAAEFGQVLFQKVFFVSGVGERVVFGVVLAMMVVFALVARGRGPAPSDAGE